MHTLYNEVWAHNLDLSVTGLPELMKRKRHRGSKPHKSKKRYGKSISERPEIAALRTEEGRWEGDTVVGKKLARTQARTPVHAKSQERVWREVLSDLSGHYHGQRPAFSGFAQVENWSSRIHFAHPYISCERPQNERHNGQFRIFVPNGVSIESFSLEHILSAADELNGCPRKKLGYRTLEELFGIFLDSVYTVPAS